MFSSCFNIFSRKLCRNYRQFYLKDKFSPVFEEQTIKINHNNEKFNKLEKSFFAQIGSNPRYTNDEDYHWFDGDGMIHGLFFNNSLTNVSLPEAKSSAFPFLDLINLSNEF